MRIRPRSVRWRLTLWYSLVLAIIVVIFSGSVYFFVKERLSLQLNHQLAEGLEAMTRVIAHDPNDLRELEPEESENFLLVVREAKVYFQSPSYERAGLPLVVAPGPHRFRRVRSATGRSFRLMTGTAPGGFVLTRAESEGAMHRLLEALVVILAAALPSALLLATLGGYFLAGRLLHPVSSMAEQANKINAENLSERLPVHNPEDEFGQLASVVNRTLSRLQNSFERLQRFTADASHELRTPLTAIQSVGEVALKEDLTASDYRDRIGSMLEETTRLTRLVESLLQLARADGGKISLEPREEDITGLVDRAVEDMRIVAEEKDLKVLTDLRPGVRGCVDADTFRQALLNILDNAIKYTPPKGTVSVILSGDAAGFSLEVGDSGPGIAPEHREKVFDRFYRVEEDRPRDVGGAGLGLAIAKWAVEVNGGRIELESWEGRGSLFRISFSKRTGEKS